MSRLPVFTENSDGTLERMSPSRPETEDSLQALIAKFPDVIAGYEDQLLSVRREIGVPDEQDGFERWSLDNLFVTRDAIPVLVEVKRATDTRIRREVVGQLMDYAANGVAYWPTGTIKSAFVTTCTEQNLDADLELGAFLGHEEAESFWDNVETNLRNGQIRLVIVADEIPSELASIIEFLNDQMRADVQGVELKYFTSQDGRRTLAPRIIGSSARTSATKKGLRDKDITQISVEEWLATNIEPYPNDVQTGARNHIQALRELGLKATVSKRNFSIAAEVRTEDGKTAWPIQLQSGGRLELQMRWLKYRPALKDQQTRQTILDTFNTQLTKLSTNNPAGYPAFNASVLADEDKLSVYKTIMARIVDLSRRAA